MCKLPGPLPISLLFFAAILTAWLGVWGPLVEAWSSRSLLLFFIVTLCFLAAVAFPLTAKERWIELANVFVVVAALIAASFAAYWAYKQAESAELQAKAAQEQNKLAQNIGRRQVKAYVIFDDATLSFADNKLAYFVEIRVKNSGTTPAFSLVWNWTAEIGSEKSIEAKQDFCEPVRTRESYDLAGGKEIGLGAHRGFPLMEGQYEEILQRNLVILVSGCFDYTDSFQKRQSGYFKLVNGYTPNLSNQSQEAKKMRLFFHSMSDD